VKSFSYWAAALVAGGLLVGPARAQDRAELEALKEQVAQLTNSLHQLQEKIATLEARPVAPAPPAAAAAPAEAPPVPAPAARAGSSYMNMSFDVLGTFGTSSAEDPSQYLQLGDHDPKQRGGQIRNAELTVDGNVDPYFKGQGNVVLKLDENNETEIELEEAYLQTVSLPANLQVKAGQYFTEFGRQNAQHPHAWAFVDQPIVLNRMFGGDGLRNVGARVSWLAPTPFYAEAMFSVQNGQGGTAFSFRNPEEDGTHGRTPVDRGLAGAEDLLYVPRLATSFDLTDNQTLVLGASAAFGPNDSGEGTKTEIYGVDQYWKWKPAHAHAGFPFVSWQTEALWRDYEAGADTEAGLPAETLRDWGLYSQVLYGFAPRWVAGFRGEYATGNDGAYDPEDIYRGDRTRISPNLTFYPSEFSKLRLQYNADHGDLFGDEQSIWLQAEFMLGAHAAHKF
jgi:hypothetical protein